jgi:hypothetical protein
MSPRRLLYAAEFGLRLLAFFLPRQRSKIRRASWAVRGYGSLIVTAIAIHQAQSLSHHWHPEPEHVLLRHEAAFRRDVRDVHAVYHDPRWSPYRRYQRVSGYGRYWRYERYRPSYRAAAPCSWTPTYPYRSCAQDPTRQSRQNPPTDP